MDAAHGEQELLVDALQRLGAYHFQTRLNPNDFQGMLPAAEAFNIMADAVEAFVTNDSTQRVTWSERDRLTCMSQLTAGIAHEIRNPLEAIVNSIALLVRSNLTPREKQELSGIVSSECTRLQRIFRHFLQFSRFPIARMEPTDIAEAIRRLFTLLGTNQPEDVEFVLEDESGEAMILCDADLIHQALMNLMLNAIEAMPKGGRLTARVLAADERHVTVQVCDNGEGIPGEQLEQIMEPFYTSRPTGVGLGLAITQHILAQHGTRLEMSSAPGEGTQASFTLPRAHRRG